ncbi:hypothetical protein MYP_5034 [Sporocytophaga myxococcoides]|uniref:Uncharacterized protein n=2 Tax=Sporocytophaga myxococcoides TaxID=153721 RepID=A0A098LP25_9BACT|nr:hypothetical protein MYP_5034 [Sporocytophaga myxococcoides]
MSTQGKSDKIISIKTKQLQFPEFTILGDFRAEVSFDQDKISEVKVFSSNNNVYTETGKTILSYNANGNLEREIRNHYGSESSKADTFLYENKSPLKQRSTKGPYTTEVEQDQNGRIVKRTDFANSSADHVLNYYSVSRDQKGNEEAALLGEVIGEDAEVKKIKFEYTEFDQKGNWIKRKRLTESIVLSDIEFNDFYFGRKDIPQLHFPITFGEEPTETIEEREVIYE